MASLNGFVSLVNALAWPLACLTIAVLFRREVRMAMGRLGQVKYAGMEVTFREDLKQAEALARTASASLSVAPAKVNLEIASGEPSELAGTLVNQSPALGSTVLLASQSKTEPRSARSLGSFFRLCDSSPREGVLETWSELSRVLIHASTVLGDRRAPAPLRSETALRFLVDRGWLHTTEAELIERLRMLNNIAEHRERPAPSREEARRFVELAGPMIERVVALE